MASFIDKIMSGDYPTLKALFEKDYFGRIVDEVFGDPIEKIADPDTECSSDRCKLKLESAMREISMLKADKTEQDYRFSVVKAERDAAVKKLEAVRDSLSSGGRPA